MPEHVTVFRDAERYAGWPANYGIWCWNGEIVVGFTVGYPDKGAGFHPRDRTRPLTAHQARSSDGGFSWTVEETNCHVPAAGSLSADEHVVDELKIGDRAAWDDLPLGSPRALDFKDPELALMCGRTGLAAGARSWFYTSRDRCRSWQGPYLFPDFDVPGTAARTDYVVRSSEHALFFFTGAKSDGGEGRVFCAETNDGGVSFQFLSWVSPEPEGFTIMPASLALPSGRLLSALRCRDDVKHNFIDLYASDDAGRSWQWLARPAPSTGYGGNPPTLHRLPDGRLCIIYGHRAEPFGIQAVLSEDDGRTWTDPVVLRDDAGNHDLGYPRTVVRADGTVVTVYYYNDDPEGERYIAATLWRP